MTGHHLVIVGDIVCTRWRQCLHLLLGWQYKLIWFRADVLSYSQNFHNNFSVLYVWIFFCFLVFEIASFDAKVISLSTCVQCVMHLSFYAKHVLHFYVWEYLIFQVKKCSENSKAFRECRLHQAREKSSLENDIIHWYKGTWLYTVDYKKMCLCS